MKNKFIYIFILCVLSGISYSQQLYLKWTNPVNITTLNSEANDFAPSWNQYSNQLFYSSDRDGYSKYYITSFIDSNHFNKPKLLNGDINKTKNNVSYITFTAEDRAYMTTFRMNLIRPYFNIFETILTREGWSSPLSLNGFILDYNMLHPTISPDGNTLVMVCDLNSDEHKTDLYITYQNDNGQWCDPQAMFNLNTDENEITPHFASNDTLFFASDGQGGPGGFDLFYSIRLNDGTWTKPNPLNDLNTAYDESDLTTTSTGKMIFASNRPGSKGGLDLYLTNSYLTEYKIAPERMLEISIATQIMTLKTTDDFLFEFFPLVNSILSDADEKTLNNIFSSDEILEFSFDLDKIYLSSFREIGKRLNNNPNAKLIIHYNILETDDKNIKLPNTEKIVERAKQYFTEVWKVPSRNIQTVKHLKKLSGSELSAYPMIYLDSDNPDIFNYLEIGKREINIDPPFSDIFIKINPAENLREWTTILSTNLTGTDFQQKSNLASGQFSIMLKDYANVIKMADSLIIKVEAINKYSDTIVKELNFDLTHSEMKKRKLKIINGVKYEQLYIFIPEEKPSASSEYLRNIGRVISESAEFSKSVTIQFFSASGQKRALAFVDFIKSNIDLPFLQFDIEQVSYSDEEPFSRKFAPFVIRIMLEKI